MTNEGYLEGMLLRTLIVICLLLPVSSCKEDIQPSAGLANETYKETHVEITSYTWGLANVDPLYWNVELSQTAFSQFQVEVFIPETVKYLSKVEVLTPDDGSFVLFDVSRGKGPHDLTSKKAIFNCECWFYNENEPSSLPLGEYRVVVTDAFAKEFSKIFVINDIGGNSLKDRIFTPEENEDKPVFLLTRPTILSFVVDDYGFVVSANNIDTRAKSYQLEFFDEDGVLVGKSNFRSTNGTTLETRLAVDEVFFNFESPLIVQQVSITLFSEHKEPVDLTSGYQAKSRKHDRDQYVDQENAFDGNTYSHLLSSHDSAILEGTSVSLFFEPYQEITTKAWYRWDLNNDGVFDTPYSRENKLKHTFWQLGWNELLVEVIYDYGKKVTHRDSFYVQRNPNVSVVTIDVARPHHVHEVRDNGLFYIFDDFTAELFAIDAQTGKSLRQISLIENKPWNIQYSEQGTYIAFAREDKIRIYSGATFEKVSEIAFLGQLDHYQITDTGVLILVVRNDSNFSNKFLVYEAESTELINEVPIPGNYYSFHILDNKNKLFIKHYYGIDKYSVYQINKEYGLSLLQENIPIIPYNSYQTNVYSNDLWIDSAGRVAVIDDSNSFQILNYDGNLIDSGSYLFKFDDEHNAIFAYQVSGKDISIFNRTTLEFIATVPHQLDWIDSIAIFDDSISVLGFIKGSSVIQKLPHPCLNCLTNQPPTALVEIQPASGAVLNEVVLLDASKSFDIEDAALSYRWDFNGDGQWDTDYKSSATVSFRVRMEGPFMPRVSVKDSKGAIGIGSAFTAISKESKAEDVIVHQIDRLPIQVVDIVYDQKRDLVYIAAIDPGRVYVFNPITGKIVNQFTLGLAPTALGLSGNNNSLFVSMTSSNAADSDDPIAQPQHFIGVVDLNELSIDFFYRLASEVVDFSVSEDDILFAMSAEYSPEYGNLELIEAKNETNFKTGSNLYWREGSNVRPIGSGSSQRVYLTRNHHIFRYEKDLDDAIYYDSIKHSGQNPSVEPFMEFFIAQQESLLFAKSGQVLTVSEIVESDLELFGRFSAEPVRFLSYDEYKNQVLYLDDNNSLHATPIANLDESVEQVKGLSNLIFIAANASHLIIFQQIGEEVVVLRVERKE